jgi:hypothetical protein
MHRREFYAMADPRELEPMGFECVPDYGTTLEAALERNARDRKRAEEDDEDPAYFDTLKLFRITIEEVPRP